MGQRASREERRSDIRLTDCGRSRNGQAQAELAPLLLQGVAIQLMVRSPLTRAIHSTLLAYPIAVISDENGQNLPILKTKST
jgi:broad specificity phosphatase PhoE